MFSIESMMTNFFCIYSIQRMSRLSQKIVAISFLIVDLLYKDLLHTSTKQDSVLCTESCFVEVSQWTFQVHFIVIVLEKSFAQELHNFYSEVKILGIKCADLFCLFILKSLYKIVKTDPSHILFHLRFDLNLNTIFQLS